MERKQWLGIVVCILLALLAFPGSANAQSQTQIQLDVKAGLDGLCKSNWIPVFATLENNGADVEGRLEVRVPRQHGGTVTTYATPVTLPSNSRKGIRLNAYLEGPISSIDVAFVVGNKRVADVTARLNCVWGTDLLSGVVAGSPSTYNILGDIPLNNGDAYVAQLDLQTFPDTVDALRALDVLVFSDIDTGTLSDKQRTAISQWVTLGGKLIVTGGPGWQKTAAGLPDILPFQPDNTTMLSNLNAFQQFDEAEEIDAGEAVIATGQVAETSNVLASQDDNPLIVTHQIGFGEVMYLAANPALAPLRSWDGMVAIYTRFVSRAADRPSWMDGFQNWDSANHAASTFTNLGLPSTLFICGFLAIYVIAVGPLNYLILRALKKRELAWVSIPVFVISFTLLAFVLGGQIRGNQAQLNRIAVIHMDADDEVAYVNGLVSVFSPSRTNYTLQVGENYMAHVIPSNYGVSEGKWTFITKAGKTEIPDIRLEAGGVRAVAADGQIPAPEFDYDLTITVSGQRVRLSGSITNNSDYSLTDASFLYPGGYEALGNFGPNATKKIDVQLERSELTSYAGSSKNPFSLNTPTYYGYYAASTLDAIVQQTYYYDDSTSYQRFNLASALLGTGDTNGNRGGGFYLSGWSETEIIPATLDRPSKNEDTTLLLVSFSPEIASQTAEKIYPPAFFTWEVIDTGGSNYRAITPYDINLNGERFGLRFMLSPRVSYSKVNELIFHLHNPNVSNVKFIIYLWDFDLEIWSPQPITTWGDHSIPNPASYVGPGGDIRVRIEDQNYTNVDIERCDFSIVVE